MGGSNPAAWAESRKKVPIAMLSNERKPPAKRNGENACRYTLDSKIAWKDANQPLAKIMPKSVAAPIAATDRPTSEP